MKIYTPRSIFAGVSRAASVLVLAVSVHSASAQYAVVQDTFTLNGTTRVSGALLNGLPPEAGAGTWKTSAAPQRAVFANGGLITNQLNSSGVPQSAEARIAIPAPAAAVTVSADCFTGPDANLEWLALGFTASDTAGGWITADHANRAVLWVLVRPDGTYAVFVNGMQTLLKKSDVPLDGFSAGTHTLALSYDPGTGVARVSLALSGLAERSMELYSGDVSSLVAGTDIRAAGFRLHMPVSPAAAGTASIDNFDVIRTIVVRDSFTLSPPLRAAGTTLDGLSPERGPGLWEVKEDQPVVFTGSGAITNTLHSSGRASGAEARIAIVPPVVSTTISADIKTGPDVGWVSVGFCASNEGNWLGQTSESRALLWATIQPNGKYSVYANGTQTLLKQSNDVIAGFSGLTHKLSLTYDPVTETVGVFLTSPGGEPRELYVGNVSGRFESTAIKAAGFRVHIVGEPQTAGTVSIDNFKVEAGDILYQVYNYEGNLVFEGKTGRHDDGRVSMPFAATGGYFEVALGGEVTGHWGPAEGTPEADGFLSIDTAMSGLTQPEDRPQLIENLRSVIGAGALARERFLWRKVNPSNGVWDWETDMLYETTRSLYAESDIKVLEMFYSPPDWMKQAGYPAFPDDLVAAGRSAGEVARRWSSNWGAVEVWNEPNISFGGNQPADQYVPLVKTFRRAMADAGVSVPVGGGVFAGFDLLYTDLAARNSLLDECNFVSFHYYSDALRLEAQVERYRSWLAGHGRETKPLWITELGAARQDIGGVRTPPDVQAQSALAYAMKATEAKACGIARAFPFVYTYYAEKQQGVYGRHFGMMDHNNSPLRMLAATAHAGRELAGMDYIGDVMVGTRRLRAFSPAGGSDALLVIYTGNVNPTAKVTLPFAATVARGVDGRVLALTVGGTQVPVPDGLTYVHAPRAALAGVLDSQTPTMRLWNLGRAAPPALPAPAQIVLQPRITATSMRAVSSRGYYLQPAAETVAVNMGVVNLTQATRTVTVRAPGVPNAVVTVPPLARSFVPLQIPLAQLPQGIGGDDLLVKITATADNGSPIGPVTLSVVPDTSHLSLADHLAESIYQYDLPIADLSRWKKNSTGEQTFEYTPPAVWGCRVVFPPGVSLWAYPIFTLPEEVDLSRVTGVLVRARCVRPAQVKLMVWDKDSSEYSYTSYSIIPADGLWHTAYVPLASFRQGPAMGDENSPAIGKISVGFNSNENENTIEISDLYMIGK